MSDLDRRSAFIALGLLATTGLLPPAAAARAQQRDAAAAFPIHPVHLLVGYPAGGGSDLMARPLAQKLSERWGQQVVVENRPGANGNLAVEAVARAAPDGYTLLLANMAQLVTNPVVYRNLPVNTLRDLAPVAQIVEAVQVVVISAKVPARTLAEFIALARQAPGRFNMGSSGNGGMSHLALELLKRRAGVDIVHVPYRGSAPALQDLLAGNIQLMIDPYGPFVGRAEAGLVRVLAVTCRRCRKPLFSKALWRLASSAWWRLPRRRALSLRGWRRRWPGLCASPTWSGPTLRRDKRRASPTPRPCAIGSRVGTRPGGGWRARRISPSTDLAGTSVETLLGAAHFAHLAGVRRVAFVMSAVCPVYPNQRTFPDSVGTSHLCQFRTSCSLSS
jgi:tripartite-type tricarboxylate transporter receptor subunit TctC